MLDYSYPLYRPPAEANNFILQVTYGCSHNNCTFCSMYKNKKYKKRNLEDIYKEIDKVSLAYSEIHKVFLADGDALSLPTSHLVEILKYLAKSFVKLRKISIYATAQNILSKTKDELELLYKYKLNLIYFGIETGSDTILKKINKGVDSFEIITALNKVSQANIKISATVILGIGGENYSKEHISKTANIINQTTVNYLSTLQLGLEEDVKEVFYNSFKDFIMLDDLEIIKEQRDFIKLLNLTNKIIFRSNHASNALHLAGSLPKDKEKLLDELDCSIGIGNDSFIPKRFRSF